MSVNLSDLPDPTVIEEISFETILAAMKTDLVNRFPDIAPILALESSAAVKVMEVMAYRELVLRARVNDAARANLLAYATGADLDHVGANSSPPVARQYGETDARFRLRILLTTQAQNVGSKDRYRLIALNTNATIADAIAYAEPGDPTVYVALLPSAATGVFDSVVIPAVEAAFDLPENRLVNSDVVVRSAVTSVVNVAASLTVTPGQPSTIIESAEASLRAAWAAEGGLGRDMTRDWIKSRLMVPGVYSVALASPSADLIVPPHEAVVIGAVTLMAAEVEA